MNTDDIKKLGIVGAGGAGFPTHIKLNSHPEYLILNAAECEPLLHKDKELLLHNTETILRGFKTTMQLTGARQGIIGIKVKHKSLIEQLKSRLAENITLVPIGDFYPAGDEVTLIYLTTGRIVQPGALPISVGCVVQNVETLYNIGIEQPVIDKYLTIAGAVSNPVTCKVPIGTSYKDVLAAVEITTRNFRVRSGGLMMGILETDLNQVITKISGGLILLPSDHYCIQTYERYKDPHQTDRIAKAGCDQCSFCTELCPRYLLGHPVRPETAMRNRMFTQENDPRYHNGNAFCCECNLCTFYSCPEGLDPKGATVIEKRGLRQNNNKWEGLPVKPHPFMDYRKVPTKKLMQRLDVLQFNNEGPLIDLQFNPGSVRIPLKQHIGKPAKPIVSVGQAVEKYTCIGESDGDISVPIHASISGRITEVNDQEIVIQR